jgi:serine/threonine-protein kinase
MHQIGAGTLGPVFRAYDAERERLVAVKLFKLDLPPERVHQLVTALEGLIVAELSHPMIAAPVAAGISEVSAYFAQELVTAESLDAALREYGPAPAADAVRVAAQLASALDFAAVVDVTHGSLHPRDVLISADAARLTGVGIARALEQVGIAPPVRRPYSAPERVSGASWDRRADVFSLAALVHELLWGRRIAGTGGHAADALTEIQGGRLAALRDVFARALAEDPNDRFGTALEFAEALKSAFPDVTLASPAASVGSAAVVSAAAPARRAPVVDEPPRLPLEEPAPVAAASIRGSRVAPPPAESLDLNFPSERFQDVEAAPEIAVPVRHVDEEPPVVDEPDEPDVRLTEPPPISVLERSRSAVWPLMASLAIGLAIGFAGGYGVGSRDRAGATPSGLAGSDATEVALADPKAQPRPETPAVDSQARPKPETTVAQAPVVVPPSRDASADRAAGSSKAAAATPSAPAARPTPAKPDRPAPIRTPERTAASRTPATRTPPAPSRQAERTPSAVTSSTTGGFVGSLMVESRPTGAHVFLDGRLLGTTPLAMPSVPAGEHAIRLELGGYRRWSSSVRVVASERNRVTASLER